MHGILINGLFKIRGIGNLFPLVIRKTKITQIGSPYDMNLINFRPIIRRHFQYQLFWFCIIGIDNPPGSIIGQRCGFVYRHLNRSFLTSIQIHEPGCNRSHHIISELGPGIQHIGVLRNSERILIAARYSFCEFIPIAARTILHKDDTLQ